MNYYNDLDLPAADWMRRLIRDGRLPEGMVDRRDIRDVPPHDLTGFTQCHFFAGIGGWPEALKIAGWPVTQAVWTGSCPCQPFSVAGLKKGEMDERHLWPTWRALIEVHRPPVIFGEQVASPLGRQWLDGIQTDLEALDYAVGSADLCAASVGSAQIRQRLWWVACSKGLRHGAPGLEAKFWRGGTSNWIEWRLCGWRAGQRRGIRTAPRM